MTSSIPHRLRHVAASAALTGLLGSSVAFWTSQALAQTAPGAFKPGEPVTLNFANAEIEAVARAMSSITGRTVVVDPRVKGTINLSTETPVTPAVAYNQFLATIRLQGYTVVQSAGLDKVVPEADAKLQGGTVSAGPVTSASNQIVTQIIRLNFENANNLVPVLRPLISPNNTINVNPGTNSLIITDYADNLQRMARIIAALDVSSAANVDVFPLKHALASDLVPLLTRLIDTGAPAAPGPQADSSQKTSMLAEPRSNSVIVRTANTAQAALVKSLIDKLDQPSTPGNGASGNIYVVYLKNADATKLAVTLRAALASDSRGTAVATTSPATTGTAGASQAAAQPTTGGQIQADPATNSLIITAAEPQYRQLRAVIDKLDARRAQVFVESLIAEVNADKAAEFGIQWQNAIGQAGNATVGVIGTNFGSTGSNIVGLSTQIASGGAITPGKGLNIGAANQTNGVYVLGFLARFLETSGEGNILSTPNLLTLDNEEAKIVIGQNVPFVTGQYTNNAVAGGVVNPFQTIERKDVGLTLRVRPQISENGTVKMTIFQEVSSVQASSVNSPTGLITNKRSIESSVLVNDGSIVVLGGLLQDQYAGNQEKVPGLADIPFFGNLFKSETRSRNKTNLMVFLRPVVMRDAAASDALSMSRYDLMRGAMTESQPSSSVVIPINEAPTIPALPARAPASAAPGADSPTSTPPAPAAAGN